MAGIFKHPAKLISGALGFGSRRAANTGGAFPCYRYVDVFAGPDPAAVDTIVTAVAASVGAVNLAIAAQPDIPRNITITADAAQTEVCTITGTDQFGNAQTEAITFNGASTVAGTKVFKTVTQVANGARSGAANISVGCGDIIGTSRRVLGVGMTSGVYTTASGMTTMVQQTTCPVKAPTANVHGVTFQNGVAAATTTVLSYLSDEAR
jgi:hypothetical protein